MKIIGEATGWMRPSPEEIQKFREKVASNKGEIINEDAEHKREKPSWPTPACCLGLASRFPKDNGGSSTMQAIQNHAALGQNR